MKNPDLDPACTWKGPAGERSIRHICDCKVCRKIWPEIAANPKQALFAAQIQRTLRELGKDA